MTIPVYQIAFTIKAVADPNATTSKANFVATVLSETRSGRARNVVDQM